MEALQEVLVEIGLLLALAIGSWVANTLRGYIMSKKNSANLELLGNLAEVAVWAVEQKGPGVFGTKKDAAVVIIEKQLREMGLLGKFPGSTIDAAIEAAVGSQFHYSKHTVEETPS
jgi:hypothetical protein